MGISYPPDQRGGLWAWDVVKLMLKLRIAKRIGSSNAVLIIMHVAAGEHREDYLAPPAFFNQELMDACGLSDEKSFIRARTLAIESGWLNYQKGDIRLAGLYWVTIPKAWGHVFPGACMGKTPAMRQPSASHKPAISQSSPQPSPQPSASHDHPLSLPSPFPYPREGERDTPPPPRSSPKMDSRKQENTATIKRAMRRLGLSQAQAAVEEWGDFLQGSCGSKTIDEAVFALEWLVVTGRERGGDVAFPKHARSLAGECKAAVAKRRKGAA